MMDLVVSDSEVLTEDQQWNRFVELELELVLVLVPHPRIQNRRAIELDYNMQNGVINIEVRVATSGYLLRLWNVDCSSGSVFLGYKNHLALNNVETFYSVDNLAVVSGFEPSKSVRNLNV